MAGRPVVDHIAPKYKDAFIQMHQSVIAGNVAKMDFEVVGLQGGRRWLETHAVPMLTCVNRIGMVQTRLFPLN